MSVLETYVLIYGALALGHVAVQMVLAHAEYRRHRHRSPAVPAERFTPPVTVVVPVYNEDLTLLYECLRSIDRQDYPDVEALVVDDGSPNRDDLRHILEEFTHGRFRVVIQGQNVGKRHSQRTVLDEAVGDVIVTIDSDTVIEPDGIRRLVQPFADPDVGAVTGDVGVINRKENFLTRLIGYRYWSAFHQERAAQSYFRVVMCASGPFSAYRRNVIDRIKDAYVTQEFLGERCTFGDDRHLTNLVLEQGYSVVFAAGALAHTHAPTTLRGYVRQQLRWNKSFYREMLWTAKFAHKRHPYLAIDLTLQAILPFLLVIALAAMAYQAVFVDVSHLWRYLILLVAVALFRSAYGVFRTGDLGFVTFVVYGFIHVLLLIPVRLYALATMRQTQWGTRGLHISAPPASPLHAEADSTRVVPG